MPAGRAGADVLVRTGSSPRSPGSSVRRRAPPSSMRTGPSCRPASSTSTPPPRTGREDAETIESGARAGALGGYTALVAMPNTNPPIDTAAVVEQVLRLGRIAPCHVVSSACITKGRAGEELAPLGELHGLGVRIFTDDGTCVADAGLMRRAL